MCGLRELKKYNAYSHRTSRDRGYRDGVPPKAFCQRVAIYLEYEYH